MFASRPYPSRSIPMFAMQLVGGVDPSRRRRGSTPHGKLQLVLLCGYIISQMSRQLKQCDPDGTCKLGRMRARRNIYLPSASPVILTPSYEQGLRGPIGTTSIQPTHQLRRISNLKQGGCMSNLPMWCGLKGSGCATTTFAQIKAHDRANPCSHWWVICFPPVLHPPILYK